MNKTALVTGASSGIGYEFSRLLARDGFDVILVARDEEKLKVLADGCRADFGVEAVVLEKNLAATGAAREVFEKVRKLGRSVDILINNAGFGDFGFFVETDWEKEKSMIDLNIVTLTALSKLFGKQMVERGSGRILNIASTAAFQPGPLMAVYYATKAYVLSFSQAIGNEFGDRGVTVTALCPGATASGFQKASGMGKSKLVKGKKLPTAKEVARYGYKALMKGKPVAIHGFYNAFLAFLIRFLPRSFVTKLVRRAQRPAK